MYFPTIFFFFFFIYTYSCLVKLMLVLALLLWELTQLTSFLVGRSVCWLVGRSFGIFQQLRRAYLLVIFFPCLYLFTHCFGYVRCSVCVLFFCKNFLFKFPAFCCCCCWVFCCVQFFLEFYQFLSMVFRCMTLLLHYNDMSLVWTPYTQTHTRTHTFISSAFISRILCSLNK